MDKKKKMICLISLIVIVIALLIYGGIKMLSKPSIKDKGEELKEEKLTLDDEVYALVLINDENHSAIRELRKGDDRDIVDLDGRKINSFSIKHNRLYYTVIENKLETVFFIEFADEMLPIGTLIDSVNVSYNYDFNEKYLFSADGLKGIKKYDLETKEVTNFMKDEKAFDLFIYDNRLYVETQTDDNYESKYYSVDFDGKDLTWITEEEYKKYSDVIGYIKVSEEDENYFFIKEDKVIKLSEDRTKLVINDEEVYETSDGHVLSFLYDDIESCVGLMEYKNKSDSMIDVKYYKVDIEKNEILETIFSPGLNISLIYK